MTPRWWAALLAAEDNQVLAVGLFATAEEARSYGEQQERAGRGRAVDVMPWLGRLDWEAGGCFR